MNNKVIKWAWRQNQLKPDQRLVLLALASTTTPHSAKHSNPGSARRADGEVNISMCTIPDVCAMCEMTASKVSKILKYLSKENLISLMDVSAKGTDVHNQRWYLLNID